MDLRVPRISIYCLPVVDASKMLPTMGSTTAQQELSGSVRKTVDSTSSRKKGSESPMVFPLYRKSSQTAGLVCLRCSTARTTALRK